MKPIIYLIFAILLSSLTTAYSFSNSAVLTGHTILKSGFELNANVTLNESPETTCINIEYNQSSYTADLTSKQVYPEISVYDTSAKEVFDSKTNITKIEPTKIIAQTLVKGCNASFYK